MFFVSVEKLPITKKNLLHISSTANRKKLPALTKRQALFYHELLRANFGLP
jgi:hypothetical protein